MFEISESVTKTAYFGVLYGPPGVGKTWLCKYAPKPFCIAMERGCEHVDGLAKFTEGGKLRLAKSYTEFNDMLGHFLKNDTDYNTIVIDSAGCLETLMIADIIKNNPYETVRKEQIKVESIGDYNFGTGYAKLLAMWNRTITGINKLNEKGINVILIAHSAEKNAILLNGEEYKKNKLSLTEFGQTNIPGLLYARANWVYFMQRENSTKTVKSKFGTDKTVASSGEPQTFVYTRASNIFDAKVWATNKGDIKDEYTIEHFNDKLSQQIFSDLEKV